MRWASFIHRYGEHGGGDLPAFSWDDDAAPVRAHRRGRHRRRLPARAVAVGRAQRALRRVARASCTATTSTSASRSARRAQGRDRRLPGHPPPLARAGRATRTTWVEAHMRIAEKWDGRMPGAGEGGVDWKQRARRAEAESRGRARRRSPAAPVRRARAGAGARARRRRPSSISWRHHRAAAPAQRRGRKRRGRGAQSSRARRISSFETTACSLATPARWRSRESRSATENGARLQQAPQQRLLARQALACAPSIELEVRAGEVLDAVGLEALEQRVAVPRLEERRRGVRLRRVPVPDHAEPEERRDDRESQAVASARRSPRPP